MHLQIFQQMKSYWYQLHCGNVFNFYSEIQYIHFHFYPDLQYIHFHFYPEVRSIHFHFYPEVQSVHILSWPERHVELNSTASVSSGD